ncbi:hypothetical protein NC651_034328 [Populus alba x Populus x berolinensis]|nr:hypothetical protein NC651_034328 [Populus alba x Populus x berolinensis]
MRALVILTSSYDKVVIQRNKFRCNQCVLPVELLFPEIKYGLLTSADSPSIGNSISAACNALEKNCEAQNFYITGASIDQTNPTHHMVLRRSRRKVKLQSQTGSIQETVEHQEDSSSESMESGIKQGNPRFTKQKQIFSHIFLNMKIYFWNCFCLGMLAKRQAIKKMLIHHEIDVYFLLETKRAACTDKFVNFQLFVE